MDRFPLVNRSIELVIAGKNPPITGTIVDIGQDILVLYNGSQHVFIPLQHIRQMRISAEEEAPETIQVRPELPFDFERKHDTISYRKLLMNAKGMFSELYINGSHTIHGYITSVMNDFFVFYSPVYHTVIVSLYHLKYLIPYPANLTPYALTQEKFPLKPSPMKLSRTFDQQLRRMTGEFVIFDLGEDPDKIGVLKDVDYNMVELSTADSQPLMLNLGHIQTVHLP